MPTGLPDFIKKVVNPDTDKRIDELVKIQKRLDIKFWVSTGIAIASLITAIIAIIQG